MNNKLNDLLDKASDGYNCNLKEKGIIECFKKLDKAYFFKKRKYLKCQELQKEFQHCLIHSNEMNLHKRSLFKGEVNLIELEEKNREWKLENKKEAYEFVQGRRTEEDILNKKDNPNARKKIIEL